MTEPIPVTPKVTGYELTLSYIDAADLLDLLDEVKWQVVNNTDRFTP